MVNQNSASTAKRINLLTIASISATAILVGCGGGGGGGTPVAPTPTSVTQTITCPNGTSKSGTGASATAATDAATAQCVGPVLVSIAPTNGNTTVSVDTFTSVEVTTDSTLDVSSITNTNVTLTSGTSAVAGTASAVGTKGFKFTPIAKLGYGKAYSFAVTAKDTLGKTLTMSSTFTTAAVACVAPQGPSTDGQSCVTPVSFTPKLMMSSTLSPNPSAVSVLDLVTGTFSELPLSQSGRGCDGFSFNPVSRLVDISCNIAAERYVSYNPASGEMLVKNLPLQNPSYRTPVACASTGTCYYGFGNISDGRVLVVKNGQITKTVFLPDVASYKVPVRMVIKGNILYILSLGETGKPSSINRFDMQTETFLNPPIDVGADAFGMAVGDSFIAVSVWRATFGKDILLFDRITGAKLPQELTVPGDEIGFNAEGLTTNGIELYAAAVTGLSKFSLTTFTQVAFLSTTSYAWEITYGNNHVYVSVPFLNKIYELDPATLAVVREFSKPIGNGWLYVAEMP